MISTYKHNKSSCGWARGYSDADRAPGDEVKEQLAFALIEDYHDFLFNLDFARLAKKGEIDQDKFLEIGGSGECPKKRWEALKDLFGHKWFTRLWVHQEVILATDCIVFTQYHSIPYLTFIRFGLSLQRYLKLVFNPPPFLGAEIHFAFLATLHILQVRAWPSIRKQQREHGIGSLRNSDDEFNSLLRDMRSATLFDCFDPRDRIYGILSIATHSKQLKEQLKVDYNQPVSQIYTAAARIAIESSNSLEFLFAANSKSAKVEEKEEAFRSWVIDWRKQLKTNLQPHLYKTAGPTQPLFLFTNDGLGLDIKGASIDSIMDSLDQLNVLEDRPWSPTRSSGLRLWGKTSLSTQPGVRVNTHGSGQLQ